MAWERVRPIAVALIYRGTDILVARYEGDGDDSVPFYRPVGGGIEVGEYAREAVRREVKEELGLSIRPQGRRGVLENVFTYRGEQAHEIVFVVEAEFATDAPYEQDHFVAREGSQGESTRKQPVTWVPTHRFIDGDAVLYPSGLDDLLDRAD
jgi:8-oxo-dGTP pyrophosphatase MutT (NUDIX family)